MAYARWKSVFVRAYVRFRYGNWSEPLKLDRGVGQN